MQSFFWEVAFLLMQLLQVSILVRGGFGGKVPKFLESLIYIIILYHFIADPPKKAETTDPATMTEYEGVSCKKRFSTGNSPGGAKATCIKDPTCWAVEGKYYCKGKKGGHIFTKKDGLVNLVEKDGAKVWIKSKN